MVNTTLPQGGSKQIGHTAASQRAQTQECFKHKLGWMLVMPRTWGWIKARRRVRVRVGARVRVLPVAWTTGTGTIVCPTHRPNNCDIVLRHGHRNRNFSTAYALKCLVCWNSGKQTLDICSSCARLLSLWESCVWLRVSCVWRRVHMHVRIICLVIVSASRWRHEKNTGVCKSVCYKPIAFVPPATKLSCCVHVQLRVWVHTCVFPSWPGGLSKWT